MRTRFWPGAVLNKVSTRIFAAMSVLGLAACTDSTLDEAQIRNIYAQPAPAPAADLKVYHLGHSLIGHDIPFMLQQLAGEKHDYSSQLGWGASLKAHWEPDVPINGFEKENAHDKYRDVFEAIDSQEYDIFVLTEMVEIKDAIKYFGSAKYLHNFAKTIREKSPKSRLYFYETWHYVNDPGGWRQRLDQDYQKYWLDEILYPALAKMQAQEPIYVIPAGQVMAAFFRALETLSLPGNVKQAEDIFGRDAEGKLDPIHLNDIGEYLVALVHYAVIYQQSPQGLPHQLQSIDGGAALAPTQEVAELMQKITWEVVSQDFRTGIPQ